MKCKTKNCPYSKQEYLPPFVKVFMLSIHEELRSLDKESMTAAYDRTDVYKCEAGHISKDEYGVVRSILPEPKKPTPDHSVKRYHRKGFRGHPVNTYERPPMYPPTETNHQRHLANRATPLGGRE